MSKEKFAEILSGAKEFTTDAAVIQHARSDMANILDASHDAPEPNSPKIGEGHAMAMLRLGGHEITQALAAFPDSNVRPMAEAGVFGNENAPQRNLQDAKEDFNRLLEGPSVAPITPAVEMEKELVRER